MSGSDQCPACCTACIDCCCPSDNGAPATKKEKYPHIKYKSPAEAQCVTGKKRYISLEVHYDSTVALFFHNTRILFFYYQQFLKNTFNVLGLKYEEQKIKQCPFTVSFLCMS